MFFFVFLSRGFPITNYHFNFSFLYPLDNYIISDFFDVVKRFLKISTKFFMLFFFVSANRIKASVFAIVITSKLIFKCMSFIRITLH